MNLKLNRISPLSLGKISGLAYSAMGLLFLPIMMIGPLIATLAPSGVQSEAPTGLLLGMGLGFALSMPIIYGVMGFVVGLVGALIYNLIAGWVGGIECQFEVNEDAEPTLRASVSDSPQATS